MVTPLVSYTENNTRREDLSDMVSVLAERMTPLFNRFGDQGMAAQSHLHEWVNTTLTGYKDQLDGAISSTATSLTVDGSFQGVSSLYQVGTLLFINGEYMEVTAVSGNTLTVTRGVFSSSQQGHADNSRVEIVGAPRTEGYTPTSDRSTFGSKDNNRTQIFLEAVSLSGTLQSQSYAGNENQMALQLQRVQAQLLKELERAIIYGRKRAMSASNNGTMGGFEEFIPASNTNSDGGPFTMSKLDKAVVHLLRNGAMPNLLVVSNSQKSAINNLKIERVERAQPQGDRTINNLVDVVMSEAGPLEIIRSNDVPEDRIYLLTGNMNGQDLIKVVPLNGRRFGVEPLAKTGDFDQNMIVGEYTMEFRNPEAHFKFTNLSLPV